MLSLIQDLENISPNLESNIAPSLKEYGRNIMAEDFDWDNDVDYEDDEDDYLKEDWRYQYDRSEDLYDEGYDLDTMPEDFDWDDDFDDDEEFDYDHWKE